jgi:hypothetical protein
MTAKFALPLMILLLLVGIGLLLNGLFHVTVYLIDDTSVMSGMRYLNWISLLLGAICSYVSVTWMLKR